MKAFATALLLIAAPLAAAAPGDFAATRGAAEKGDAEAQFQLGEAYRTGKGVTADHDQAVSWYKKAAAQGHVQASDTVGFLLFTGGQRAEAMPYIEKAAARGDARAFYLLGTAHFNGDYGTRDWALGYAQMRRAAEGGLLAAKKSLIVMDHYLLPADKAKAETILTTLPPVKPLPANPAANAVQVAEATPPTPKPVVTQPSTAAAKPATAPASPPPKPVPTQAAAPIPPRPAPVQVAQASPPPTPIPTPTATPTQAPVLPAVTTTPPAPRPHGNWRVQLGAFGSQAAAHNAWTQLATRVPALRQYELKTETAGVMQRLQASGLPGRGAADALCRQVQAAAHSACFAVAP